jgi:predicted phosphodiesterase
MRSYAIISDIHGNSLALEAVLADIRSRGINQIINLGDHFFGALEPERVADMLRANKMLCISGNTDREILQSIDSNFDKEGMGRVTADL